MPIFPKKEADMMALLDAMVAGYMANPVLFPHADVAALQAARADYRAKDQEQNELRARAQIATKAKQTSQKQLVKLMKNQLQQSEVDASASETNLPLIGWDKKTVAKKGMPPGQPLSLKSVLEEKGIIKLEWKAPAPGSGGRVRFYLVERRVLLEQGFSAWEQAGIALFPELILIGQPDKEQMEYRVIAQNTSGQSAPSNSVSVVL